MNRLLFIFFSISLFVACKPNNKNTVKNDDQAVDSLQPDPWSASNFYNVPVKHLDLDLIADFEEKILKGSATWTIDNSKNDSVLILDTDGLQIDSVILNDQTKTTFNLATSVTNISLPLTIRINPDTKKVKIFYSTIYSAIDSTAALQWLEPEQTFGKKSPFLYSQNQPILARTWYPCQDVPAVRFTYNATIKAPVGMMALMSAENPQAKSSDGIYHFEMDKPVPSYLVALAIGDLTFKSEGANTGVYAEPEIIEKAYNEMTELPQMIAEAEKLYGPYQWGRYDVLVLPMGFPIGGMENPKLTFATPTILAGDKSLMNLIAHELAHSWSGNLVTNSNWNDLWLNEGFTVYFERRITEAMKGKDYVDMLWALGRQDLDYTLEKMGKENPESKLKLSLDKDDPANSLSDVAYEKGSLFLKLIEQTVGRQRFDQFLNKYFAENKFKPMNTELFIDYLNKNLLDENEEWKEKINYEFWIYQPGLPADAPVVENIRFKKVNEEIEKFAADSNASKIKTDNWSTYEWLHFLRNLKNPTAEKMARLDNQFHLTQSQNSEIAAVWFTQAIKTNYQAAYPSMKNFLEYTGREKFLEPIYDAMLHSTDGLKMANEYFTFFKKNYHPIVRTSIGNMINGG